MSQLYEYYNTGDDCSKYKNPMVFPNDMGQSFTVGTVGDNHNFFVTKVRVKVYKHRYNNTGNLVIKIYNAPFYPCIYPHQVYAEGEVLNADIPLIATWVNVIMTSYLPLKANGFYILWLDPQPKWRWPMYLRADCSAPTYNGGHGLRTGMSPSGLVWSESTHDFMFEVWGEKVPRVCIKSKSKEIFKGKSDSKETFKSKSESKEVFKSKSESKEVFKGKSESKEVFKIIRKKVCE